MKFNKKRPIHTKTNKLFYFSTMILLCIVIFLSIGFSAFQNDLSIENISATVRIDKDIRVMKVGVDSTNEATSYSEDYKIKFVKTITAL